MASISSILLASHEAIPSIVFCAICCVYVSHQRKNDGKRVATFDLLSSVGRSVGRRFFPAAVSLLWNSLPTHIQSSPSLPVFRQRLKTFLFSTIISRFCTVTLLRLCRLPNSSAILATPKKFDWHWYWHWQSDKIQDPFKSRSSAMRRRARACRARRVRRFTGQHTTRWPVDRTSPALCVYVVTFAYDETSKITSYY